jgi:uncharacterized protein Usg
MPHATLSRQLEGFSLTTAEILYRLPDYPRLLQSYIWQDYDVRPVTSELPRASWRLACRRQRMPSSARRSTTQRIMQSSSPAGFDVGWLELVQRSTCCRTRRL